MADDFLITGLRDSDPEAARELLLRFELPLKRYFAAALRDRAYIEDAVQEVFLRLISLIRRDSDTEIRSLDALVFTIARRLAIDIKRSQDRRPWLANIDGDEEAGADAAAAASLACQAPGPRECAAQAEQIRHIEEALAQLDEETREVIVLRHMENLSSREVARILDIAEGTVWSRLHRGLQLLRRKLTARTVDASSDFPSGKKG